jgi:site-specific DNA-adenine methylase
MTGELLPYVYFGGKRRIASVVWERLGNVKTYVEPFFGGGAVFWLRPLEHFEEKGRRCELLNDIDGMVVIS